MAASYWIWCGCCNIGPRFGFGLFCLCGGSGVGVLLFLVCGLRVWWFGCLLWVVGLSVVGLQDCGFSVAAGCCLSLWIVICAVVYG